MLNFFNIKIFIKIEETMFSRLRECFRIEVAKIIFPMFFSFKLLLCAKEIEMSGKYVAVEEA